MFWLASRPDQAMIWGQAGGSLRTDSAGVWWSSMPFRRRVNHLAFIENQAYIEKGWHEDFGDRKNEIVIIGQDIEEEKITKALDAVSYTHLTLPTTPYV